MSTLQAVAMGLVIVFVDAGSNGWDWIMDPLGWALVLMGLYPVKERLPAPGPVVVSAWVCLVVSVLIFPPDSVDAIDPSLGWLFSIPTVAFCFLLSDSLADVTEEGFAAHVRWFRWLRVAFVVVGLLPLLVYFVGWSWLTIPTAGAAVLTNLAFVVALWAAGSEDEEKEAGTRWVRPVTTPSPSQAPSRASSPPPAPSPPKEKGRGGRRKKGGDVGFDAEAVKRRVRRERGLPEEE